LDLVLKSPYPLEQLANGGAQSVRVRIRDAGHGTTTMRAGLLASRASSSASGTWSSPTVRPSIGVTSSAPVHTASNASLQCSGGGPPPNWMLRPLRFAVSVLM